MPAVDDFAEGGNFDRGVLREVALSRIGRGSISPQLLEYVVGGKENTLEDEEETLEELREKSRERIE